MKYSVVNAFLVSVLLLNSTVSMAYSNPRKPERYGCQRGHHSGHRYNDCKNEQKELSKDEKKAVAIAAGVGALIGLVAAIAENNQAPVQTPAPATTPEKNEFVAYALFDDITHKSGGEWVRLKFKKPAYIDYVTILLNENSLKVHDASLVTASGRRIRVQEFVGITARGPAVENSDYIRAGEKITAIDIRAQSTGTDYASVFFMVKSAHETPEIVGVRP